MLSYYHLQYACKKADSLASNLILIPQVHLHSGHCISAGRPVLS
nr:MAG TPA: hypothetical protein [Bacteriophage sp.]